jgi:hypothetical protein
MSFTPLEQLRAIRAGGEGSAIIAFNGCHKELKEAIKRAAELDNALTEPALLDLKLARAALQSPWAFLQTEPDLGEDIRDAALKLDDTLKRESFFRELPTIDQLTRVVEKAYEQRYQNALSARANAYTQALNTLRSTPGWEELDEDQRRRIAKPLESRCQTSSRESIPIPELRSDLDAGPARLGKAVEELLLLQEGARLVKVNVGSYFSGGIESEEQLTSSLNALRDECLHHLGAGKKVLIQ